MGKSYRDNKGHKKWDRNQNRKRKNDKDGRTTSKKTHGQPLEDVFDDSENQS